MNRVLNILADGNRIVGQFGVNPSTLKSWSHHFDFDEHKHELALTILDKYGSVMTFEECKLLRILLCEDADTFNRTRSYVEKVTVEQAITFIVDKGSSLDK